MAHILDRAAYHLGWAAVFLGIFFGLLTYWMLRNRKVYDWLTDPLKVRLVISALLIAALMPIREPYDVMFKTQVNYKTPFDQAEWFVFAGGWAWIAYRVCKFVKSRRTK